MRHGLTKTKILENIFPEIKLKEKSNLIIYIICDIAAIERNLTFNCVSSIQRRSNSDSKRKCHVSLRKSDSPFTERDLQTC